MNPCSYKNLLLPHKPPILITLKRHLTNHQAVIFLVHDIHPYERHLNIGHFIKKLISFVLVPWTVKQNMRLIMSFTKLAPKCPLPSFNEPANLQG